MTSSDICALCGGKLREGFVELVLKAGAEVLVIKRVPALVCSCCCEAYLTPEVSEKIDRREASGKTARRGRDRAQDERLIGIRFPL
jgi:YgiT-type zinc finger domain-containing protein